MLQRIAITSTLLSAVLLLGGCIPALPPTPLPTPEPTPLPPPETLADIAYDVNEAYGYTVYLLENDEYTPYLVLTNDYGGNVLLLRERVLDEYVGYSNYPSWNWDDYENISFDEYMSFDNDAKYGNDGYLNGYFASYYNGSNIDVYLNEIFLPLIETNLTAMISETEITITAEESLAHHSWEYVEKITRKVFSLSCTEIGWMPKYILCEEGVPLKYFKDDPQKRTIAHDSKGPQSWLLRTAYVLDNSTTYIGYDGGISGGGNPNIPTGVRPAFCLPGDLEIQQSIVDIKSEKTGYVVILE